jgi:hypothetical protein
MKTNSIVLAAALLGSVGACIIALSRGGDLRLERPEWMSGPSNAASDGAVVAVAEGDRSAVATTAVKEMAVDGRLADALQESNQVVVFRARALVDAGIAQDVAEGMVKVVEQMEPAYAYMVSQEMHNVHRYGCEFLLAIWPTMGDLIRRGDLKLNIEAFPPENWSKPKVGLAIAFEVEQGILSYSMNMDRWSVSFDFRDSVNPEPDIYKKIVSAAVDGKFK